jgi:hypothetical protein
MKIAFLLLLIIILSCSTYNKESSLTSELAGEWRNTYLKVEMNSYQNQDTLVVMIADTSNWEAVIGLKPIRTFFLEDGTYHSDHYSLKDSLLFSAKGSWKMESDTLVMDEVSPAMATYRLKTVINQNEVEFAGHLDFDEDGRADDFYVGKQRRIQ